jgi:hypothetical protein
LNNILDRSNEVCVLLGLGHDDWLTDRTLIGWFILID